jgi:hypothetical protein
VVDESGKDVSKNDKINSLVLYSNSIIEGNEDLQRVCTNKTPNSIFRLLNVIFNDEYTEKFQATGDTMNREELDAHNGATEFTFS